MGRDRLGVIAFSKLVFVNIMSHAFNNNDR